MQTFAQFLAEAVPEAVHRGNSPDTDLKRFLVAAYWLSVEHNAASFDVQEAIDLSAASIAIVASGDLVEPTTTPGRYKLTEKGRAVIRG